MKSNIQFLFLSHGIFSIKKEMKVDVFKSAQLVGTTEGLQPLPPWWRWVSPLSFRLVKHLGSEPLRVGSPASPDAWRTEVRLNQILFSKTADREEERRAGRGL